jgi:hypothetical protein
LPREALLRSQKVSTDHKIDHVYPLKLNRYLPHMLIGESNSKNTGCSIKMSLDFKHIHFISFSKRLTGLGGLNLS